MQGQYIRTCVTTGGMPDWGLCGLERNVLCQTFVLPRDSGHSTAYNLGQIGNFCFWNYVLYIIDRWVHLFQVSVQRGLFSKGQWNFCYHKIQRIPWKSERPLSSQERLCAIELVPLHTEGRGIRWQVSFS